ncbi:hypothetical protein [Microbacterium sp.]|uniref:hypothetical protein n=1 Tax=Microbacterium sp. TaxID=51671 RepID=UPI000927747C|nr:hypothetical protein [Microbacterium sp.]MBN9194410.1 hypothetical protein [Microbacterium sp.]OJU71918.1 MAG: hypothetical protein BGO04_00995 [Microbacterium sp. 70-38]
MIDRPLRVAARRLRHRSRSVAVSIALVATALVAVWVAVESVLAALGRPALLWAPARTVEIVRAGGPAVVAVGAVLAVLGLVAVVLAFLPGRLARRELPDGRAVYVVDDEVLASGISRVAARAARVGSDQVRTVVSRRRSTTHVRPTTGFPPDAAVTSDSVTAAVDGLGLRPAPRASVVIARSGVAA